MTKLEQLKAAADAAYTAFLKADAAHTNAALNALQAERMKSKETNR